MTSTTSSIDSKSQSNGSKSFAFLSPFIDSVSIVLLPSLIALFVSAMVVGHGHMSAASLIEVFDMMATASSLPAISP